MHGLNHVLSLTKVRETHAHADHLTASQYLKQSLPGNVPVCAGERIMQVQNTFGPRYGYEVEALRNDFDIFFKDNEEISIGEIKCRVIPLPGHTPDNLGYVIGKNVFHGDSLFLVCARDRASRVLPLNLSIAA